MTTMVWVYLGYLAICIGVTMLVARTLQNYGPVFMAGEGAGMAGKDEPKSPLILAKTHLMVVGFYLVVFGLVGFALKFGGNATDTKTAIEVLSTKLGMMVLLIGFMHFVMVGLFAVSRKNMNTNVVYASRPNFKEE